MGGSRSRFVEQHLHLGPQRDGWHRAGPGGAQCPGGRSEAQRHRQIVASRQAGTQRAAERVAGAGGVERCDGERIDVRGALGSVQIGAEILQWCDIVVPNEHEVELLGGVAHLLALGARAVVVTLGADGADLHTAEGTTHVDAFAVTPLDTTGAGDTFSGALCARLAAGDDLPVALRFAAAAGALCTTRAGAVPSIPLRAEVEVLLNEA